MAACGNCRQNTLISKEPAQLFQIHRGYQACWNGMSFAVETDSRGWALRIQDSTKKETLYTAHRVGPQAAQFAAAEYAIFHVLGPGSALNADRLVKELNWQAYW